ncbi:MAG TPA: phosphate acyltransferase PlsX [Opitutae bacterium]|nr:phosphate acyltransferase PlsX [Myxococcales bacterium]HCR28937.1 phosphate acyltransferase PlsX [Opitutae bacterium]
MHDRGNACIAVDAMGSDKGPSEMVAAVALALKGYPSIAPIILVGQEDALVPCVKNAGLQDHPKLSIQHASQIVDMEDKPLQAMKQKKDSSMARAIELVKEGKASVVVSCGNTGTLMASGTIRLRTMEGIERPALATVMPRQEGHFVLIDAGANPSAKPEHLVHNAVLGSAYCQHVLGTENPRVGLMTIGTEEGKGNETTNAANDLLKSIPGIINYHGPIEGFQLFENVVDVVVCDGFTGNVILKTAESLFKCLFKDFLGGEIKKNPVRQLGYLFSKGAYDAIRTQLNPERYGGAPLLGIKGNILKAHGSSNREAVKSAIRIANEIISKDLNTQITSYIAQANRIISPPSNQS